MRRITEYHAQVIENWMLDGERQSPFEDSFMRSPLVLTCGCLLYTLDRTWQIKKRWEKGKPLTYCSCDGVRRNAQGVPVLTEEMLRPRLTVAQHQEAIEYRKTKLKQSYFMALMCGCCLLSGLKYSTFVTTCRGPRPIKPGCKLGRQRYNVLRPASLNKFWRTVRDEDVWLRGRAQEGSSRDCRGLHAR